MNRGETRRKFQGSRRAPLVLKRDNWRRLSLISLIAGRRTIIGHGVPANGDGNVQGRLHDDTRQSQSEFRRRGPRSRSSNPAVHGIRQRHHARHPGHQPIRVAGQSRVLRSPREQRKASMIMEIVIRQGRSNYGTRRAALTAP